MGTSSSHISWGHQDKALISISMLSHGMGHGAKSLTSNGMLPPPFEKKPAVSREGLNPVQEHRASNCLRHMLGWSMSLQHLVTATAKTA